MKKQWLMPLSLLLAVLLVSCAHSPVQSTVSEPPASGTSEATSAPPASPGTDRLQGASSQPDGAVRIRFSFEGGEATGVLEDNVAAQSLVNQLPLTVTFSDFAGQEKIAYFPTPFTLEGAPRGNGNRAGDICIYAPWGNLVVYYVDSNPSNSLIRVGTMESGLDAMVAQNTDFEVTIEVIENPNFEKTL